MADLTDKEKDSFLGRAYALKTQDQTNQHYNSWNETYDADMKTGGYGQPKRVAAALSATGCETTARILDVGCGTGLSGVALTEAGFQNIDGNDISQAMLDKAADIGIYNSLAIADLNKAPIDVKANAYDVVTAVGVFSFAHVMPEALDEVLRLTIKDGLLIIGLNKYFYEDSDLRTKITELVEAGRVEVLDQQLGVHMANTGTQGWVITLKNLTR